MSDRKEDDQTKEQKAMIQNELTKLQNELAMERKKRNDAEMSLQKMTTTVSRISEANFLQQRYVIVGSWNGWKAKAGDMTYDGGIYRFTVRIGTTGKESFQILMDGDWDWKLHPDVANACPYVPHWVMGPGKEGRGLNWTIGSHQSDQARVGDRFDVMLRVNPLSVDWCRCARGKPLEPTDLSLQLVQGRWSHSSTSVGGVTVRNNMVTPDRGSVMEVSVMSLEKALTSWSVWAVDPSDQPARQRHKDSDMEVVTLQYGQGWTLQPERSTATELCWMKGTNEVCFWSRAPMPAQVRLDTIQGRWYYSASCVGAGVTVKMNMALPDEEKAQQITVKKNGVLTWGGWTAQPKKSTATELRWKKGEYVSTWYRQPEVDQGAMWAPVQGTWSVSPASAVRRENLRPLSSAEPRKIGTISSDSVMISVRENMILPWGGGKPTEIASIGGILQFDDWFLKPGKRRTTELVWQKEEQECIWRTVDAMDLVASR